MNTREVWRSVPSIEGVLASSHGRVMVVPFYSNNPRAGIKQWGGFPTNGIWDGKRYLWRYKNKNYKVARLVCEAFHGIPLDNQVCMHLDEDSRNNDPKNLSWGTQQENLNAPGFLDYCHSRTGENSPTRKGRRNKGALS